MSQHSKGTALGRHTSAVHVGAPPATFLQDFVSTKVYFHGFADLPTENGECVHSPTFFCLGYEWWLSLFPRGEEDDAEYLSIFLRLRSDVCIEIECSFTLGDRISTVKSYDFDGSGASLGFHSAWTRETVLTSYLTNGSFVIEVRIKPKLASPKFIPDNPLTSKDIRSLWFNEEEYADVVFEIVTKVARDGDSNKASTTFYAHRNILRKAAPQLADLASMSKEKPARVEISNVSSRTFRAILSYIYGLAVPKLGQDLTDAKEIIVAADLFGLTNLKLEAEATYVSLLTLTLDNVMEHLHFADSKNCALLKEEVIAFIIKNTVEAVDKKVIKDAPGSLGTDILAALARKEIKGVEDEVVTSEFSAMCISELRREAYKRGLDVDGSREALISVLESDDEKADEEGNEDDEKEEEDEETSSIVVHPITAKRRRRKVR